MMAAVNELISVVIPVYNGERYLEPAVSSVLQQEYRPLEIIIVDDGSTDRTAQVAGDLGDTIRYFYQENSGASAARNKGIRLSQGSLLAFLDSDDLWLQGHLTKLSSYLKNNPELDMVNGGVEQFLSPDLDEETARQLLVNLRPSKGILIGALLIRKQSFIRAGYLDENLRMAEFVEWFDRAQSVGLNYKSLPETVLKRRIHSSNMGIISKDNRSDYLTVIRQALKRRKNKEKE